MPTTWEQMFDTGRDASVATEAEEEERRGLFSRMRESLSKSRRAMTQQLTAVMFDPADADVWERLEEALIYRSEEHTSELQSQFHLVCRLLLEKKKKKNRHNIAIE